LQTFYANDTIITFSDFDCNTHSQRIVKVAHPLRNSFGSIGGVIVFEYNNNLIYNDNIIPPSFKTSGIPFVQFKTPDYPQYVYDFSGWYNATNSIYKEYFDSGWLNRMRVPIPNSLLQIAARNSTMIMHKDGKIEKF